MLPRSKKKSLLFTKENKRYELKKKGKCPLVNTAISRLTKLKAFQF